MTTEAAQNYIDQLDDLLNQERKLLLEGNLPGLAALAGEKEKLIRDLNALDRADRAPLAGARDKLQRNSELLNSAMTGIQAVATRMAELRKARDGLDIYDESGRRTRYGMTACTKLEKRA
jgi:flagellar biosynthesis/type III secretory pathway chaperone